MLQQLKAILVAQFRMLLNFYSRPQMGGKVVGRIVTGIWYGSLLVASVLLALAVASPGASRLLNALLAPALLLAFLYWQFVPVFLASAGLSLDLRRLKVYPIADSSLFFLDTVLRTTIAAEPAMLVTGLGVGLLFNPTLPWWAALWLVPFAVMNVFLAAGIRDLLMGLMEKKRVREFGFIMILVLLVTPQLFAMNFAPAWLKQLSKGSEYLLSKWTPWGATASLSTGRFDIGLALFCLVATGVAFVFGYWQFRRGLHYEAESLNSRVEQGPQQPLHLGWLRRCLSALLPRGLATVVEKEMRFLARAPRFRMIFIMGFTFGLIIWLPMVFGSFSGPPRGSNILTRNYLSWISVYGLMMLGEVTIFNAFGFDRSAAAFWLLAPISPRTVLVGKNIAALFFVVLQFVMIATVCLVVQLPVTLRGITDSLCISLVMGLFLLCYGNLSTMRGARGVNPAESWRSRSSSAQAWLLLIYPLLAMPMSLPFLARYAFEANWAFYGVLGFVGLIAFVLYRFSLDAAMRLLEENRETMLTQLSEGESVIA
jgi:ABC-2 type transport system permease protein